MSEESGKFDVRKLRSAGSGIWLPIAFVVPLILAAIAWGANANRLANLESQTKDAAAERDRIEQHISADDQQITVLQQQLKFISQQLEEINRKLDRAEEERRK